MNPATTATVMFVAGVFERLRVFVISVAARSVVLDGPVIQMQHGRSSSLLILCSVTLSTA